MNKYSIDYNQLHQNLAPKKKSFKLKDVESRLKKVAFDVVRFIDSDNIDGLWQIRKDENGEYIVAMYDESGEKKASPNNWQVLPNKMGNCLHVFYKNEPIKLISLANLGIPLDDVEGLANNMAKKLADDKVFLNSFLRELTASEKAKLDQDKSCKACETGKGDHDHDCPKHK